MRAAYLHVMADALTSVLAIAALLAGSVYGWLWLNPLMGIVAALLIARALAEVYRDCSTNPSRSGLPPSCAEPRKRRAPMDPIQPEPHVALIGEDDPAVRELAGALLEETELDIVEVDSGDAALAYLQDHGGEVAMMCGDDVRRHPPTRRD